MDRSIPRSAPGAARAFLALLLLYVGGLLGQGLHLALSPHQVCEHGDLQHAERGHASAGDARGAAELDGVPRAAPLGEPPAEQHHHCAIATANPLRELEPLARPALAGLTCLCFVQPTRGAPRAPSIAVYRLAPHHSPPLS